MYGTDRFYHLDQLGNIEKYLEDLKQTIANQGATITTLLSVSVFTKEEYQQIEKLMTSINERFHEWLGHGQSLAAYQSLIEQIDYYKTVKRPTLKQYFFTQHVETRRPSNAFVSFKQVGVEMPNRETEHCVERLQRLEHRGKCFVIDLGEKFTNFSSMSEQSLKEYCMSQCDEKLSTMQTTVCVII